jgi:hypothetical protein
VIWFALVLAVLSAALLADWNQRRFEKPLQTVRPVLNYALGAALLALPLGLLPGVREGWWPRAPSPYDLAATPYAAAHWLAQRPELPGPLWSDYVFGGYLVFALPERETWIDSRFNAFPPEHWQAYISITRAAPGWQQALDADGVQLLMLSSARQPDLLTAVTASGEWCERYRDPDAVIFTRRAGTCR